MDDVEQLISVGRCYLDRDDIPNARKMFARVRELGDYRGGLWLNRIMERNEPTYKVTDTWKGSKGQDKIRLR